MDSPALTFGSVCSGIEAASVAWEPLGWKAAWFSEIEPFPCALLAQRYPDTPNHGDMTTLPERVRAGEVEAPDVFTGGTPCQAFSVAGKRESLADARGNLSLTFCEIADAIDDVRAADGREPCVVVWENVPGVLSTPDNAFGCFLGALAGSGCELQPPAQRNGQPGTWANAGLVLGPRRTVAWRVLDAQFFGLAQRRKRVFVVASARDGFDPGTVLLEFDGVRRDSAPRREAGEGAAEDAGHGAEVSGGVGFGGGRTGGPVDVAACLVAKGHKCDFEVETFIAHTLRGEGFDASEDGTGRGTPLVPVPVRDVAATIGGRMRGQDDACADNLLPVAYSTKLHNTQSNQAGKFYEEYTTALDANSPPPAVAFMADDYKTGAFSQIDVAGSLTTTADRTRGAPIAFSSKDHGADAGELAPTLRAMGHDGSHANGGGQVAVAVDCYNHAISGDVTGTISCTGGPPLSGPGVMQHMAVRRLTPTECERLQGFEDNYTLIPWRGKPAERCPDGPRYKALGNSWAVPNVRWIGRRIQAELQKGRAA